VGPWPRREAPALAGGDVLERLELRPLRPVAKDEQATRFRTCVERSVRRADRDREDVPLGQLDAFPAPAAIAAEKCPGAPRSDDHAVAIRGDGADRDSIEHRASLRRRG